MNGVAVALLVGIAISSIVTSSVSRYSAYGDEDYAMPSWIKDNASGGQKVRLVIQNTSLQSTI